MKRNLPIIFILVFAFIAFFYFEKYKTHKTVPSQHANTIGTFAATLPCADCPGIKTDLTLTSTSDTGGTYVLHQTYIERNNNQTMTTTGEWVYSNGTPANPQAIVYELDPNKPNEAQFYLKINDTQIKMLDSKKQEIDSPFTSTLTKQ